MGNDTVPPAQRTYGSTSESVFVRRGRIFALAISGLSAVIGGLVLLGWRIGVVLIPSGIPSFAMLKPNTAICFVLVGVALWCRSTGAVDGPTVKSGRVLVAWFCGGLAALIGLVTLAEYVLGIDFYIDELAFSVPPTVANPGRMALATAAGFVLLGSALIFLDTRSRRRRWPAQFFAAAAACLGLWALQGYIFSVEQLYPFGPVQGIMAWPSAALFSSLGIGVLLARADRGWMSVVFSKYIGGAVARRLLPLILMTPFVIGWLWLQGEKAGWYGRNVGVALFATTTMLILGFVAWHSAGWLNAADAERSRTEEAQRESEERFRMLFEHAPLAAIIGDPEAAGRSVIAFNTLAHQQLGYTREEFESLQMSDILPHLAPEATHAEGGVRQLEIKHWTKLGEIRDILVTSMPLQLGGHTYVYAAAQDITERKRIEQALKDSETRYSTLAEALPAIVFTALPDGRMDYVNRRWHEYTGLTFEQSEGFGWRSVLQPDDRERSEKLWMKAVETGTQPEIEYRFRRRDGVYRWFRGRATPLRDSDGQIVKWLGVYTDIEDQKKSEERLREWQKLEAIGRLAGGVAHDFNNLLTAITGYNALVMEQAKDQATLLGYSHELQGAAERAAGLTQQLLAFSRRQVAQPKFLNVNDIVVAAAKLLHRIIGEDIELTTNLAPDLGIVRVDPVQLDQVIMNLVVNARDAMPEGGQLTLATANIVVREDEADQLQVSPGDYVMLTTSDTGIGIDAATKSRLFEPFFTTKEQGKGTGLGLSIVYGIVRQNSGCIEVDSEPGQGTRFKIYLPRCWESVETPAAASTASRDATGGGETVLLVEDEAVVRRLVGEMLRKQGYSMLEAATPSAAITLACEFRDPIHLLLTDVLMPEMRGPELAKRLRELRPDLRVLFMSGYADSTFLDHRAIEDADYVQKPFMPAELGEKIRRVLRRGADP